MKSVFDQYSKKYDAWYDRNTFTYLSELEALKKVLPKQGAGLEIGVGTGRFAHPLGIMIGIDPSRNMVKMARQRGVDAWRGYGESLLFNKGVFDYAAIIITLCFLRFPQLVLKEVSRVLKPKGKIVVGIVDRDSFLGKFYQKKNSLFYKSAKFFSIDEVTDLLKKAGFNKFSYYQTIFDLPNKITSIQRPRKGFGKGGFVVIEAERK